MTHGPNTSNSFTMGGSLGGQSFFTKPDPAAEIGRLASYLEENLKDGRIKNGHSCLKALEQIDKLIEKNPHLDTREHKARMKTIGKMANDAAQNEAQRLEEIKKDPSLLAAEAEKAGRSPHEHLKAMEAVAAAAAAIAAAIAKMFQDFVGVFKRGPRPA